MENKIDKVKIERYSEILAGKLCNNYFVNNQYITGGGVVKFTPIPQINYFILENIFGSWIEETSKLESPFFDYNNDDVQDAIREFMNKLSHHIKVDRDNFEPLLIAAIRDTINLVLSPYSFFKQEYFTQERGKISMAELKELSKYIKVNDQLIKGLIEELGKFNIDEILIDELLNKFTDVYNTSAEALQDVEEFVEKLNELQPVKTSDFLKKQEQTPSTGSESNINSKLSGEKTTLHDQLKSSSSSNALVDSKTIKKIDNIAKSIGINQKYSFVNELFNGDSIAYTSAIEELDTCESLDNANLILDSLAQKFDWNPDKEEVLELMDLVDRRY